MIISKTITLFILICFLTQLSIAPNPPPSVMFCSTYCLSTGCTGMTANDCNNKCNTGNGWYNVSGNTCDINPAGVPSRAIIDTSDDIGGAMTVSPMSISPNCGNMSLQTYGTYTAGQTITVTLSTGTDIPHYALQLFYSVILIDADANPKWDKSKSIKTNLNGGSNQNTAISNSIKDKAYCGASGDEQWHLHPICTFTHTNLSSTIAFNITSDNSQSSSKYVLKEFILVAKQCNFACMTCFNQSVNGCWSCDPSVPMLLSGTTCNQSCLANYGPTLDPTICVKCHSYCTACYNTDVNCSACVLTGTNKAYLYINDTMTSSCIKTCPTGYWANSTSMACELCDPNCTTCISSPTKCYSCVVGYGWYNYLCYFPCNSGFYSVTNITNNVTNCTKCSVLCLECTSATACSICTIFGVNKAYLSGTSCVQTCPSGFYGSDNNGTGPTLCLPCDSSCSLCTGNPSPCQGCTTGSYLYNNSCGTSCPAGYIMYTVGNICLDCATSCVGVTMKLYFPNTLQDKLYIDMTFSKAMDFTTFSYSTFQTLSIDQQSLSELNITYSLVDSFTYRITVVPIGYIFLYNATFTVTTQSQSLTLNQSADATPFKLTNYLASASIKWYLIQAPQMSDLEKTIINGLGSVTSSISSVTALQGVQEIKKTGIFSFLFSGAQLTSATAYINTVQPQNMYQGVRFWGIFVLHDCPPWQQNSDKPYLVVSPDVATVVKNQRRLEEVKGRVLFDMTTVSWRYQRTGHSSFFIYDAYIPMLMIVVCWLMVLVGKLLKNKACFAGIQAKFYTTLHKIHEISIFYICTATILEWLNFDAASTERWISLIICIIFNLYFVGYELYIYYDMIKYPLAEIGNEQYEYYIVRYSTFLKNIRYQEYDFKQDWSPKHWFRPYNYHILSYYKKFCMIVALPLFYDTPNAQIFVLIALQLLEIVRLCYVQPFAFRWRNNYRFFLELAILIFFMTIAVQAYLLLEITKNDPATLTTFIEAYYSIGWVGFVCIFTFNIGFLVLLIIDIYRGCKQNNREMIDEARRLFYFNKLNAYEKENEDIPIALMNKWVKKGNLNQRDQSNLPNINLRVQYFRVVKQSSYYEISIKKIVSLFMNVEFNFHQENNTRVGEKIDKRVRLTKDLSANLYFLADNLFRQYGGKDVESIAIKTFVQIEQKQFRAGDRIPLEKKGMFQKIEVEIFNQEEKKETKLNKLLEGFPINPQDLKGL